MLPAQLKIRETRLQKYARILSNRYKITLKLSSASIKVASTDSASKIWLNADLKQDPIENLLLQKGALLHEVGHILYTSSSDWRQSGVNHDLANLISDGRCELGMSRLHPKSKLYFIYTNNKLCPYQFSGDVETETMELIFRTAKHRTGIPPMTQQGIDFLGAEIGASAIDWFVSKTNDAVTAKTEKDATVITQEIEQKLVSLFQHPPATKTAPDNSIQNCGGNARKLPEPTENEIKLPSNEPSSSETIEDTLKKVNKIVEEDALGELKNETEMLKQNNVTAEFDDYDDITNDIHGQRRYGHRAYTKPVDTVSLEPTARRIAHTFKTIAQSGNGWEHGKTRGKLEMHRLTNIISNDTARVFKKKEKKPKTDLTVTLLLDASGSMHYSDTVAMKTTYTLTRAFDLCNFNTEVVAFGLSGYNNLYGIKSFNQKLNYCKKKFTPVAQGNTPLLDALKGAEKSMKRQDSARKIVFVITDGQPNRKEACKEKIKEIERQGVIVYGILIHTDDYSKLFRHSVSVYSVDDVSGKIQTMVKEILASLHHH